MINYMSFEKKWKERRKRDYLGNRKKAIEVAYSLCESTRIEVHEQWKDTIRRLIAKLAVSSPTKAETMNSREVAEVQRGALAGLLGE